MDDIIRRFLYAFLKVFIAGTHIERYRMTDKILAMPYNSGGMFRGFLYKEKGSPEIKKGCGIGKKIVVVGEK